jgi:hypothetical protein
VGYETNARQTWSEMAIEIGQLLSLSFESVIFEWTPSLSLAA